MRWGPLLSLFLAIFVLFKVVVWLFFLLLNPTVWLFIIGFIILSRAILAFASYRITRRRPMQKPQSTTSEDEPITIEIEPL